VTTTPGDIDHMVGERCNDDDAGDIDQAARGRRGDYAAGRARPDWPASVVTTTPAISAKAAGQLAR
jgi:hypothetical protein